MTEETRPFNLGQRLSAARLKRGFSQGAVALRAGLAPSYLSRVEHGKIQPTFQTVVKIVRALRADLQEIAEPRGRGNSDSGVCPVTSRGQCLLDLVRPEAEVARGRCGEAYTPREVRLLRRLAMWMKSVEPDRLRAMEILLDDWIAAAEEGEVDDD